MSMFIYTAAVVIIVFRVFSTSPSPFLAVYEYDVLCEDSSCSALPVAGTEAILSISFPSEYTSDRLLCAALPSTISGAK